MYVCIILTDKERCVMAEVPPSSMPDEAQVMLVKDADVPYIRPKLKKVPDWMYDKSEDFCGVWTLPGFMWTLNLLACIFHSILIIVTVLVSTNGGKGLDTPTLTIYRRKTTWNGGGANGTMMNNATSIFTPELVEAGWALPLSIVTIVFFGLSASFHGFICLMNFNQAFALRDEKAREITMFTGWYFKFLNDCRQPLRWIECMFHSPCSSPCSSPYSLAHQDGGGGRGWIGEEGGSMNRPPHTSFFFNSDNILARSARLFSRSSEAFNSPTFIPHDLPAKKENMTVMDNHGRIAVVI